MFVIRDGRGRRRIELRNVDILMDVTGVPRYRA